MATKMKELNSKPNETNIADKTEQIMNILKEGRDELPTIPKKEKQEAYSEETRRLLQQRKNAKNKLSTAIKTKKLPFRIKKLHLSFFI